MEEPSGHRTSCPVWSHKCVRKRFSGHGCHRSLWPRKTSVRFVAEGLDVDQKQAQTIVQRVLDTVLATLAAQGRVELRTFGVFEVKRRVARKDRNQARESVRFDNVQPVAESVRFGA